MTPEQRVGAFVLVLVLGMLLGVALISIAKASTRHVVSIGPGGGDPVVCIIDRNDQVWFRNDTGAPIVLRQPWGSAVNVYVWEIPIAPGESKGVEWNLDNVNAGFEIDGVVVVTVKTTDDPPPGSCAPTGWRPVRIVIGGIASG